jgi:hypothetical protein
VSDLGSSRNIGAVRTPYAAGLLVQAIFVILVFPIVIIALPA